MAPRLLALAMCCATLCGLEAAHAAPSDATEATAPAANAPKNDLNHRAGTLSDKLSDTNGVIHPEGAVDPKMRKKAPSVGTMPVIPPPGSPGGATGVQPK